MLSLPKQLRSSTTTTLNTYPHRVRRDNCSPLTKQCESDPHPAQKIKLLFAHANIDIAPYHDMGCVGRTVSNSNLLTHSPTIFSGTVD